MNCQKTELIDRKNIVQDIRRFYIDKAQGLKRNAAA